MPEIDFQRFFDACNPGRTLVLSNPEDSKYYIDFASVRGGKLIEALERTITHLSPAKPTCQLFSGHVGCGKSTELLRLKTELEQKGFYVIYFESTEDIDTADVDVSDILLAIARQVSDSLEKNSIHLQSQGLKALLKDAIDFLQTPIGDLTAEFSLPGAGKLSASSSGSIELSLPAGIAKITAKTKDSPSLRSRLRQYLEPRTNTLLKAINEELLIPGTQELKKRGVKGLVVIVDNLDRIDSRPTASGRSQPEYLFIDRGEQLRKLSCHVVYTIPLAVIFSNDNETLKMRLGSGVEPKVLPMVPVQHRDGQVREEGLALLRQMILARAFPDIAEEERLPLIPMLFDHQDTLDRLCRVSGGHVRNLLGLMYSCLQTQDPPWSKDLLESVIRQGRDHLVRGIDKEWDLLFQVVQRQTVSGEIEFQTLLRSLFVFEYRDHQGCWFGLNPFLEETERYKVWKQEQTANR